jgi:GTP pyrophosphokinase
MASSPEQLVAADSPAAASVPVPPALFEGLAEGEARALRAAVEFARPIYADKLLGTGEDTLEHAFGLAANVAALRLDVDARVAGVLFAVPEYLENAHEAIGQRFGAAPASLVAGITRLNSLRVVTRTPLAQDKVGGKGAPSQAEVLRKMLLAMVADIRVVLLRLASRTQTLRYLAAARNAHAMAERETVARETLDIYAPLANRLGVWQLKWEMEDLSFRFLEPATYKRIAAELDERRVEREAFIAEAMATLRRELAAAGVPAEVSGRPKHIYSIWNKMRQKSLDFSELYDVRALRVLVDSVKDCYTALGVVHNLWQPIPREFDDYISRPKGNFYRSLHTAVIGPDGRALEVQIRTHDMHRHAELGVAAHWRYKEGATQGRGGKSGDAFDEKIAFLRQVLAWRDDVVDSADWVEQFKHAALDETVYVLTPQGRVIDLPAGATPIDFAYAVHTDLGHRCRGAKVDGRIVPLDYALSNGQRVDIVVAKTGGPSRDWLNPATGYIRSSRARNKVRQWFNSLGLAETMAEGRAMVERELQREGKTGASLDELAARLGFGKTEDLFAAVGREDVGHRQLQEAIHADPDAADDEPAPLDEVLSERLARKSRAGDAGEGILVVGVDRLMTQLARCCKPVPPDPITGFVTRGRGVSVHRSSCPSLAYLLGRQPERALSATWAPSRIHAATEARYATDMVVRAGDRPGLLKDISEVLAREHINVTAVNTLSRQQLATLQFTLEVKDLAQLRQTLAQVAGIPGVLSAERR